MKEVVILRAVSGSGKSTFAELLCAGRKDAVICCADDYFMVDGEYKFDVTKLKSAHTECYRKFLLAAQNENINLIVVANTNTAPSEFKIYEETAKLLDIRVFHVVIENRHGSNDVHNVPSEAKERQRNKLSQSIQL